MNAQIMKPIVGGLIIGAALFFLPFFLLKVLVFLLVVGLLFWLFGMKSHRGPRSWAYADKIRSMSEDDFNDFNTNWSGRCYGIRTKDVQTENK